MYPSEDAKLKLSEGLKSAPPPRPPQSMNPRPDDGIGNFEGTGQLQSALAGRA
jgi:hypothetical protein